MYSSSDLYKYFCQILRPHSTVFTWNVILFKIYVLVVPHSILWEHGRPLKFVTGHNNASHQAKFSCSRLQWLEHPDRGYEKIWGSPLP